MIRKFEFKNNYLSEDPFVMDAMYSSVGYFDGMDTEIIEDQDIADVFSAPMAAHYAKNEFYEECDHFRIVGIRDGKEDEKESEFWNDDSEPFIFITCLRLKKKNAKLECIQKNIELYFRAFCYYTLDSSDLVIAMRSSSYIMGCSIIEKGYPEVIARCDNGNSIQKGFSVLSVKQALLDDMETHGMMMEQECVSCMLNCIVNQWEDGDDFLRELKKATGTEAWSRYATLGSNDIVFWNDDIPVRKLFALYAGGGKGLLTHGNMLYKKLFLNIHTELLVQENQVNACMKKIPLSNLFPEGMREEKELAEDKEKVENLIESGGCGKNEGESENAGGRGHDTERKLYE